MKEATGELNMTVVTVVAIAAVGAFFYAFIWPAIKTGLASNTCKNICPAPESGQNPAKATKDGDDYICTCPDGTTQNLDETTTTN
mgnify:CR=1 FL=1